MELVFSLPGSHGWPAIVLLVVGAGSSLYGLVVLVGLVGLFGKRSRERALRAGALCLLAVAAIAGLAWASMQPYPGASGAPGELEPGEQLARALVTRAGNQWLLGLGLILSLLPGLAGTAALLSGLLAAPEEAPEDAAQTRPSWPVWLGGFGLLAGLWLGLWAMTDWLQYGAFQLAVLFGL